MSLSTPATLSSRQGLVVASDLSESLISLKGISPSILASGSDPIKEISRILRDDPVDHLNIVAHGAPGSIGLGSGLNKDTLIANQQLLAEWNVERIALWSCEVAQDKDFIALLEEFTGADVVASKKKLGLGSTLLDAGFSTLEDAVRNLPFELHTNTVGFDVNDGSQSGSFDVTLYYGSWHSSSPSPEGALSLFTLSPGGDKSDYSAYNVEAYGNGGTISNNTFGFGQAASSDTINLVSERNSTAYTDNTITNSGFELGSTYYQSLGGELVGTLAGGQPTYTHQSATVQDVQPGTYRAFYDDNPVGETAANRLSMNYTPDSAIQQMLFTVSSTGEVIVGEPTGLRVAEGTQNSVDLDTTFSGISNPQVSLDAFTVTPDAHAMMGHGDMVTHDFSNAISFNSDNIYSLDLTGSSYDYLNDGEVVNAVQAYTVSGDQVSEEMNLDIVITGENDPSVITLDSDLSGTVNPGSLVASGDVDLTDLDRTAATFVAKNEALNQGSFDMDVDGGWTFNADLDYLTNVLAASNSPEESISIDFQTTDGTTESIDIELVGNRAPVAINDSETIAAGQIKSVDVVFNDTDLDAHDAGMLSLDSINTSAFATPSGLASMDSGQVLLDATSFADLMPGSGDIFHSLGYTVTDSFGASDVGQLDFTITAPDADGTVISTSLADFDSISSDLHGSIIGINAAAVDVDGSATVQTPVVLNSDSSASVVSGDTKAVADTTSIEGITDSSFDIASDLDMAASVQSTLDSSATSTNGIAVSNSLIGSQQGIELTDVGSVDAIDVGGIANIAVGSSMSAASVAETVGDGSGNSGSLGVDGSWSNAIADDHLGLGSGDLGGILGIDVASDASISSSLASSLSADATADAGVAVSNAALNASTGMEDLAVEVGGLGLVSSINQSELDSTASSTTDDASAIGLNELASGILNSDFNFSDVDSVMSAQTISEMDVDATTTTGNAWSSLDSASVGFEGATSSITGAAEITAIASDQGFTESATVAGQATAIADQSAIGMDGYSINNSSDLQLTALAEVDSTADSSATMI